MKKETRIKYIEAMSSEEFERKMNDALKGLCEPKIQIYGKYEGAIIYTEHIYEEEKTIADLFEEAGCGATCGECSMFTKPTDGRVKWVVCGKGRRVSEDCRACDSYYLERRRNVPEIRGGNEEKTDGHGVSCGVTRLNMVESIPQEKRTDTVHAS